MGDSRRNRVFVDFLKVQFPPSLYSCVMDVAGGNGQLSRLLTGCYELVYLVEPKPRGFCGSARLLRGFFPARASKIVPDLYIGMHPDGATWPIIEESTRHKKPFALVPCCRKHLPPAIAKRKGDWGTMLFDEVVNRGFRAYKTLLPIGGANLVIWGYP